MAYKKNKGCSWHLIWLCALFCFAAYIYINWDGKTYHEAKERLLRQETKDSVREHSAKDTVWMPLEIPQVEKKHTIEIPIEVQGKLIYAKANINGIDMRFVLDTGCTDINMTYAELYFMKHMGKYNPNRADTSTVTCQYADGSTKECKTYLIDSVKIGTIRIDSVECTVEESLDAQPLLGQAVLMKLGEVSIDYENMKLKITRNK